MLPSIPPDAVEAEQAHREAQRILQSHSTLSLEKRRREAIHTLVTDYNIPYASARELITIIEGDQN